MLSHEASCISRRQREMVMRLLKQIDITGKLLLTAELMDASATACDFSKFLIINPMTMEPYIPGSCIKDCLKNLLFNNLPPAMPPNLLSLIFPAENGRSDNAQAPARLVVRDALPNEATFKNFEKALGKSTPLEIMKTIKNGLSAEFWHNLSPMEFRLQLGLRIYEDSMRNEKELLKAVLLGLKLLEQKGLGECVKITLKHLEIHN